MITSFLLAIALTAHNPGDSSFDAFQHQLAIYIERYMKPPPDMDSTIHCYHYTELLKVEIDKRSHITSITFSDSAPGWLKTDITRIKEQNRINYKKLDNLASKAGLRSCSFVFPLALESDDFPYGQEAKKRKLDDKFFQFEGRSLKRNIILENLCVLIGR
jgi:hypothetical protein